MAILVTGGAGYIGSIAVDDLKARGEDVVVVDNLVYGHREAVDADVPFYHGNIGNRDLLNRIFAENDIEACMHFSAYAYVGESVEKPQKYFENNYVQTLSLLDDLVAKGIKKFIFSSTYRRSTSTIADKSVRLDQIYGRADAVGVRKCIRPELCRPSIL